MISSIRSHLGYANIVATLAFLFAMSGGALAASQYLINSTKQISPAVLKKLEGRVGPRGATGPPGIAGANGATGQRGEQAEDGTIGYSASGFGPTYLDSTPRVVLEKTLPAGHYIVSGNVAIQARGEKPGTIDLHCSLSDEASSLDDANSEGPLGAITPPYYQVLVNLTLNAALNTYSSSEVVIKCDVGSNEAEAGLIDASDARIVAVATSTNR